MKKYLLATTAAGASMALSAPALADGYLRVFGGFGLYGDQNLSINSISSVTPPFSSMFSYDASDIPTSPTSGFVPLYPAVYRSMTTVTGPSTTFGTLQSYRSLVFNYQASGAYTTMLDADVSVDGGFVVGAAVGLDLGNGLSFEIEMAYRKASGDAVFNFQSYRRIYGTTSYVLYTARVLHITASHTTMPTSMPTSMSTMVLPTTNTISTSGRTTVTTSKTVISSGAVANTGSTSYTFIESGDLNSFAVMANVWWDLRPNKKVHPYVGIGFGWANVDVEFPALSVSDSAIAFQLGAGIGYDLSENVRINVEYRYFTLPQLEMLSPSGLDLGVDYDVSEVLVGFRYSF